LGTKSFRETFVLTRTANDLSAVSASNVRDIECKGIETYILLVAAELLELFLTDAIALEELLFKLTGLLWVVCAAELSAFFALEAPFTRIYIPSTQDNANSNSRRRTKCCTDNERVFRGTMRSCNAGSDPIGPSGTLESGKALIFE